MMPIITLSISEKLDKELDRKRGDMPKSRFVSRLLEESLKMPKGDRAQYD